VDRTRTRACLLIALAAAALCSGAGAGDPPIRAARWTTAERRFDALTHQPAECVAPHAPGSPIGIGRAAFRTPLLLGGQAARAGLSCASCHRNGRGNPDFLFPGLSGAPGTADVTSSLMSGVRGDHAFNPVPIPDLAGERHRVPRGPSPAPLRRFIRGLIVEEFDGAEPAPAVLDGLTAYVRAIDARHCGARGAARLSLAGQLDDADRAARAAAAALRREDVPTARLMLGSARTTLGLIDERFAGREREQQLLIRADRTLRDIIGEIEPSPAGAADALARWRRAFSDNAAPKLRAAEQRSLFNRRRLAARL